jgi:hypothetical protein
MSTREEITKALSAVDGDRKTVVKLESPSGRDFTGRWTNLEKNKSASKTTSGQENEHET